MISRIVIYFILFIVNFRFFNSIINLEDFNLVKYYKLLNNLMFVLFLGKQTNSYSFFILFHGFGF